MDKLSNFLVGTAIGAGISIVFVYIFGPAHNTEFNRNYRSRLDRALEEGEVAADEYEAEVRRRFEESKQPRTINSNESAVNSG